MGAHLLLRGLVPYLSFSKRDLHENHLAAARQEVKPRSPAYCLQARKPSPYTSCRPLETCSNATYEPIVVSLSIYVSFNFSVLYSFLTAIPLVFGAVYGFTPDQQNLPFIAVAIGCLIATPTQLVLAYYIVYQRRNRGPVTRGEIKAVAPEQRLYGAIIGSVGLPVGTFLVCLVGKDRRPLDCTRLSLIPFAWGNMLIFVSAALYTVDVYQVADGASAVAANGLLRYVFGTSLVRLFHSSLFKCTKNLALRGRAVCWDLLPSH